MSQENVEVVRRWVAARNKLDFDSFGDLYDVDAELIIDPAWIAWEPVRGRAAIRAWHERLAGLWGFRDEAFLVELVEVDDHVVARWDWSVLGRSGGIEMRLDLTTVNLIADGRIVRQQYYVDHAEALKAVGLEE